MKIEFFLCDICGKKFKRLCDLSRHVRCTHKFNIKKYYDIYLKKSNKEGICLNCKKETTFGGLGGYEYFCSQKCSWSSPIKYKKAFKTYKFRTGYSHPSKNPKVKNKKKNKCLIKYNKENPSQVDLIKEKKKETCIKHFGVDHPMKSKIIRDKYKHTCLDKFGVSTPLKSKKIKAKIRRTYKERFGFDHPLKNKDIIKQIKKTCLKKYGVTHWAKTEEGRKIHRIISIKYAEKQLSNGEPGMPRIGDNERPFLNELQNHTEYEILRQDPSFRYIKGRFPDGHIPELNLFIQFDERDHFTDKTCKVYKEDDINCTLQLASLGYIVFRVSEKKWNNNKEKTVKQFKELISCQKEQL